MAINVYFNMLRINSHINQYSDMGKQYTEIIRIICDDWLPKKRKYELKQNIELKIMQSDTKGVNFDPITIEAEPEEVLINLAASIANLRKNIAIDGTSKRVMAIANEMKRASYKAEFEYKYVLALNYPEFPVNEGSNYFNLMIDYIQKHYEHFDIVEDLRPYFALLGNQEIFALKNFEREKLQQLEKAFDPEKGTPPDIKLIRWRIVHFKINKLLGSF